MFADEVFVFTPQGDVSNLPAGATPIDFAYSIHSAVGNSMVGAKVNGRLVQFDYRLQNGDVVEILTSKSAHGPSRGWMKIARSSEARSKIRQWFKREKRDNLTLNKQIERAERIADVTNAPLCLRAELHEGEPLGEMIQCRHREVPSL